MCTTNLFILTAVERFNVQIYFNSLTHYFSDGHSGSKCFTIVISIFLVHDQGSWGGYPKVQSWHFNIQASATQVLVSIHTRSIELEFPISPRLGVLRLLGFCQPLKQYLKPVLILMFISLTPQCFHLFLGCLGFLFCDLPICCLLSTALSGYLPLVVILVLILCQLLASQISYPALQLVFSLCVFFAFCVSRNPSLPLKIIKTVCRFFPAVF